MSSLSGESSGVGCERARRGEEGQRSRRFDATKRVVEKGERTPYGSVVLELLSVEDEGTEFGLGASFLRNERGRGRET